MTTAFNIPNILTVFRMIASLGVLIYGWQGRWDVAFPIFCAGAFTDMVDGAIARILKQRTELGGLLDPIADKLLMFFSFLPLTLRGFIPYELLGVVMARDIFLLVGLLILKRTKVPFLYRPTYLSKVTTVLQILTVLLAFVQAFGGSLQHFPDLALSAEYQVFRKFIFITVAVFTVVTGFQYYFIGKRIFSLRTRS
jgi:cardiolipin synthase